MVLAAGLTLGAATCGGGDDDSDRPTTTTSTASTTTTLTPEEEVEAAYLAFWDMFVRLAQDPNANDPEIRQRTTGEALGNLLDGLTTLETLNRRSEFGPQYKHNVLTTVIGSGSAVVTDCAVDDSRIVDEESGAIIEERTVTELSEVTLVRNGEAGWLVDHSTRLNAWNGAVECV